MQILRGNAQIRFLGSNGYHWQAHVTAETRAGRLVFIGALIAHEIGERAGKLILDLLDGKRGVPHITIKPELIGRKTSR